jgi:hypothetical protein
MALASAVENGACCAPGVATALELGAPWLCAICAVCAAAALAAAPVATLELRGVLAAGPCDASA